MDSRLRVLWRRLLVLCACVESAHPLLIRSEYPVNQTCTSTSGVKRENVVPVMQCRTILDRTTKPPTRYWVRTECSLDGKEVTTVAFSGAKASTCGGSYAVFGETRAINECATEFGTSSMYSGVCSTTATAPLYSFRVYSTKDGTCNDFLPTTFPHFDDAYDAPYLQLEGCRAFVTTNVNLGGVTYSTIRSYALVADAPPASSVTLKIYGADGCTGAPLRAVSGTQQGSDVTARICVKGASPDGSISDVEIYRLNPGGSVPTAPPTFAPPAPQPSPPSAGLIWGVSIVSIAGALMTLVIIVCAVVSVVVIAIIVRQKRRSARGGVDLGRSDLFEPLGSDASGADNGVFPMLGPPAEDPPEWSG